MSATRALQYAVYEYHRHRNDPSRAAQHFEEMFLRNFKRHGRLQQLIDELAQYHVEFQSLGNTVVAWGQRIAIRVNDDFELTGEIGRLDLAPNGRYAVWLLAGNRHDWQDELRMPLIQAYFARRMVVDPDGVDVGFYFFDQGVYESLCFNADDISTAFRQARELGSQIVV